MKIDFHTHGKLAKYLEFSPVYTDWLFTQAKDAGLDALCLTEHFNTTQFAEVYSYIRDNSSRVDDCLIYKNGLKIFAGMETDIIEGGHILSIGRMEDILELNARLEEHKEPTKFLPLHELFALYAQYDLLVGAAHPFREGGHIPECAKEDIAKFSFFDLNGKDVAMRGDLAQKQTYDFGKLYQKPVVAGSDTHQALQYGCIYNEFSKDVTTLEELRNEVNKGNYQIHIADDVHFKVTSAALLKKALKAIDALGGDYVAILSGEN